MNRFPLIRRDLDNASRREIRIDAAGLAVTATCHPGAPLFVWYREGVLTLRCASCRDMVGQIAVASVLLQTEVQ
jgi:hypothetical protein